MAAARGENDGWQVEVMAMVSDVREFRGLVELSLDGALWLRVRKQHFFKRPLGVGEDVDPDAYVDALAALQAADCYEAALCMLDQAAHSGGALCEKLVRRGYVRPAAEAAVERLKEIRIVDDEGYAQRMAQAQLKRPVGAYAVRRKLQAKRLPEDAIEAAMAGFDDEQQAEACRAAAEKLQRKYAGLPSREARAKLSQALARRGFGWDQIRGAVDALISEWDEADW